MFAEIILLVLIIIGLNAVYAHMVACKQAEVTAAVTAASAPAPALETPPPALPDSSRRLPENPASAAEQMMLESIAAGETMLVNNLQPYENMTAGCSAGAMNDPHAYEDYNQYIKDISLDKSAQASHKQFVKDRLQNTFTNMTGSMWPSRDFNYDPVPWVGLNRPRAVPFGNPTNLADVDHDKYATSRKVNL